MTPTPECRSCGAAAVLRRGLCSSCYRTVRAAGDVRPWRPAVTLVEDVEWMLATGETHPEMVALRAGMTWATLSRALRRAQRPDLIARLTDEPVRA